nr:MAG TPA: hypothetical protein [Crassvirales sp.]
MIHIVVLAPFSLIKGKNFVKGISQVTKDTEVFIDEFLPVKIITTTRTLSLKELRINIRRCGYLPNDGKLFNREYDGDSLFFSTAIDIYSVRVNPTPLMRGGFVEYVYIHYRFVQGVDEIRFTVSLDEVIRYY